MCSPSFGAGRRRAPGVAERRGMTLCTVTLPISSSGTSTTICARLHVRVGDELVDVVDRRRRHLGGLEDGEALRAVVRGR